MGLLWAVAAVPLAPDMPVPDQPTPQAAPEQITPDLAAPQPPEPEPDAPPSVADSDVREFIAVAARKQVGKPAYGGIGPVDKLMVIARGRGDFPEVLGSAGVPQRQQLSPPPDGSVALVRFRQSRDAVRPGPSAQDLDYVATHKLPLFVIGEWSRSIPMWEVAWTGQQVQYRSIGDVGEIGPWHD